MRANASISPTLHRLVCVESTAREWHVRRPLAPAKTQETHALLTSPYTSIANVQHTASRQGALRQLWSESHIFLASSPKRCSHVIFVWRSAGPRAWRWRCDGTAIVQYAPLGPHVRTEREVMPGEEGHACLFHC